jgi:hypothetical protein
MVGTAGAVVIPVAAITAEVAITAVEAITAAAVVAVIPAVALGAVVPAAAVVAVIQAAAVVVIRAAAARATITSFVFCEATTMGGSMPPIPSADVCGILVALHKSQSHY